MKKAIIAALATALVVTGLAAASGHTVHSACFGTQWYGKSARGISHGDVNVLAKYKRVCIVGRRGKPGLNGKDGAAGATGATGSQGSKGDTGATGAQGEQGPAGADGINGTNGTDGIGIESVMQAEECAAGGYVLTFTAMFDPITVCNGLNGKDGTNGADGAPGTNGIDGTNGTNGIDGTNGADGAPGPQGPKGDTGATGSQGPKGDTGATGPQGPKGDPGTDGLGNGIGYLCVSNGGNVKWGGIDGSLCNPGHDTLIKVVTVTP